MKSQNLLPLIVFSQFAGTSLWFAGNMVISNLNLTSGIAAGTSFVQFGFIAGSLIFSIFNIADRFESPRVFFLSALLASAANIFIVFFLYDPTMILALRMITGFFLAGIYPVGMKIAADYMPESLGKALGFLVGALVLGTAFPHLLHAQLQQSNLKYILIFTSLLAFSGGFLIWILLPGRKPGSLNHFRFTTSFEIFKSRNFRSAAFGYFGHMWELYAFWAFLPFIFNLYNQKTGSEFSISVWSFLTISAGTAGCIIGGLLAKKWGNKSIAFYSLLISGCCCLIFPFIFQLSPIFFLTIMIVWGFTVVADSPQFSVMVAQSAPAENKGTALTMITSIGFAITIASILVLQSALNEKREYGLLVLCIGPLLGLVSLKNYLPVHSKKKQTGN